MNEPKINSGPIFLKFHLAALQLLIIALAFGLPLFFNIHLPFFSQDHLEEMLTFEFGVLVYGFYLTGFLFLPLARVKSLWGRRVCITLACLIAIPLTAGYRDTYGVYGLISFLFLLFANFSSVFIASLQSNERMKLTAELGMRCIVYLVVFSLLIVLLDMSVSIEGWNGDKALNFGFIYFGVLTGLETLRVFRKCVDYVIALLQGKTGLSTRTP